MFKKLALDVIGTEFGVFTCNSIGAVSQHDYAKQTKIVLKALEKDIFLDKHRRKFLMRILPIAFAEKLDYNQKCRMLLGSPGVGKTTMMRSLVKALPLACQSLAVYIDHRKHHDTVIKVVAAKLQEAGLPVREDWASVQNMVLDRGIRLFVFTDEVEDVLLKKFSMAETVFSDLHCLGDDTVGGWWAMVTGSTTALVRLRSELNGRKYQPVSMRAVDVSELPALCDHFAVPLERRKAAFWFTGGLYANIDQYARTGWEFVPHKFGESAVSLENLCSSFCKLLCKKVLKTTIKDAAEDCRAVSTEVSAEVAVGLLVADPLAWADAEINTDEIESLLKENSMEMAAVEDVVKTGILRWNIEEHFYSLKVGVPAQCWFYSVHRTDDAFIQQLRTSLSKVLQKAKDNGVPEMLSVASAAAPWVPSILHFFGF